MQAGLVSTRMALGDIFTACRVTLVFLWRSLKLVRLSSRRARGRTNNEPLPDQQRAAQVPEIGLTAPPTHTRFTTGPSPSLGGSISRVSVNLTMLPAPKTLQSD